MQKTASLFKSFDKLPTGIEKIKPTFFESEKEVDEMVMEAFGIAPASKFPNEPKDDENQKGFLPEALETFEDMSSDEGISQMAFYGIGSVVLKKCDEAVPAAYQVMKDSLHK